MISLSKLYHGNKFFYFLLLPIKKLKDRVLFNKILDKRFIIKKYKNKFDYTPNIDSPSTFNEKIQHLKIFNRDTYRTQCVDKYRVRPIIEEKIGKEYLIPLVKQLDNVNELSVELIPDYPVIIKANHASGKVFIIKSKKDFNLSTIQKELSSQLKYNFYHALREWQYKKVKPCIIIEKLLMDEKGDVPNDYKIHCFNGKPHFIQVDTERFNDHKRAIYDTNWNKQDITWNFPRAQDIPPPNNLPKMLDLAKKLSKEFDYVRVDLYEVDNKIYFGELTFTPGGGFEIFTPNSIDKEWGQLLNLSS